MEVGEQTAARQLAERGGMGERAKVCQERSVPPTWRDLKTAREQKDKETQREQETWKGREDGSVSRPVSQVRLAGPASPVSCLVGPVGSVGLVSPFRSVRSARSARSARSVRSAGSVCLVRLLAMPANSCCTDRSDSLELSLLPSLGAQGFQDLGSNR